MKSKQYIYNLKPTGTGLLTVAFCLFAIPFIADFFLLFTQLRGKRDVEMSSTLLHGYLRILPWFLLYIILHFIATVILDSVLKKYIH